MLRRINRLIFDHMKPEIPAVPEIKPWPGDPRASFQGMPHSCFNTPRAISDTVKAEQARAMISARIKAALAAAKARGTKLGGFRGVPMTRAAQLAGSAAVARQARQRAAELTPVITELQQSGITTWRGIAASLNARGIRPPLSTNSIHS